MAETKAMRVWDAVETLSDRGRPVVRPERSMRSISFPVAIITLSTLAIAAVPLALLDPDRVDGLPLLLSLFVFPMIAASVIIELVVLCKLQRQEPLWTLLWWPLAVLPIGLLTMSIGPVLAHPDYFDVTSAASAAGVMLTFAFLVLLGLGVSFVTWALIVFPLRILGLAAVDAMRGERIARFRIFAPLLFLAIPTVSLTIVASLGELETSRAVVLQVVLALLSIPGEYEIVWGPGLWIVRGIALALIGVAIWARVATSARSTRNGGRPHRRR
ncbi:hypothetical protein CFK41_05715 [Brachybacterium ginsengisoli]|uniref:Uncharacterized protein n=1 Tax=Brachybacterium ginsengisoli TaxID=1331682 RepID=A0A291GVU4_9MICO|nr:hypothetical protein [Brachybacterium ginsengisoli]ATG54329.1 hypothetical protein CFK41_05715 [Brachybacterium ginsengisoli]